MIFDKENIQILGKLYGMHRKLFVYCRYIFIVMAAMSVLDYAVGYNAIKNTYVTEATVIDMRDHVSISSLRFKNVQVTYIYKDQNDRKITGTGEVSIPRGKFMTPKIYPKSYIKPGDKISVYVDQSGEARTVYEQNNSFGGVIASFTLVLLFVFLEMKSKKEYESLIKSGWQAPGT